MRKLLFAAGFCALAACGGAETGEGTAEEELIITDEDGAMGPDRQTTDREVADSQDIVTLAMGNENLSTLVAAVKAAGLVETLQGDGPFTVFAPTNEAFDALPAGTLDNLLKPENQDQLKKILTYHVVGQEAMSSSLSDGQTVGTVEGSDVTVSVQGGNVMIDGAKVVTPDVAASNGVVHVIDKVIMPGE